MARDSMNQRPKSTSLTHAFCQLHSRKRIGGGEVPSGGHGPRLFDSSGSKLFSFLRTDFLLKSVFLLKFILILNHFFFKICSDLKPFFL